MRKLANAVVVLLLLAVTALLVAPQLAEKRAALVDVGRRLLHTGSHQLPIAECAGLIARAKHNVPVIERAADYMGTIGSGTSVFRDIARIAADSDIETDRLDKVLDLAVLKTSDTSQILSLARTACRIETDEQAEAWEKAYRSVLATADFASLEEAVETRKLK